MSQKKASGPRPPANSGNSRSRRGTLGAIAEKRNKDLADTVAAEDNQRKAVAAAFAAERESMLVLYEDESRRVKDSLIAVLEKRLYAVRSNCSAVVAEAESSLESVLQGATRLLMDCHRAGMLVVQKLEQVSEVTPPPTKVNSSASMTLGSNGTEKSMGSAGNRGATTPPPAAVPESSFSSFEGINKIAPVVPVVGGGSSHPSTPTPPQIPASPGHPPIQHRLVLVEEEERIARFFHPDQPENKLNTKGSKDLSRRLQELSVSIVALVNSCLTKLKTAHARIEHLERSLDEQVIQRASCEKMLGEFLVRGRTESDRVVERCRELLTTFEGRMKKIETDARAELTSYIKQGVDAALARAQRQDDPFSLFKFESNAITDGYLTTLERTKALHQQLLRDIELKVVEFSSEAVSTAKRDEVAKLFRSGLPLDCRELLNLEEHFDRASAVRLLEHVSFEPRTCEVITALIREYKAYLESRDPAEVQSLLQLSRASSGGAHLTSTTTVTTTAPAGTRGGISGGRMVVDVSSSAAAAVAVAAMPAAHIVPPSEAHLINVNSSSHSIVPTNLFLTPFNKFWVERELREERERQERLHAARFYNSTTHQGDEATGGSSSSALLAAPTTTLERRQLIEFHIGDGGSGAVKNNNKTSSSKELQSTVVAKRPTSSTAHGMSALAKAFSEKHRQLVQQLSSS